MKKLDFINDGNDGNKIIHNHPCTIYCPKTGEAWEASFECADAIDVIDTNYIKKRKS